jgi:hypothetical protein
MANVSGRFDAKSGKRRSFCGPNAGNLRSRNQECIEKRLTLAVFSGRTNTSQFLVQIRIETLIL